MPESSEKQTQKMRKKDVLVPPLNFAMVAPRIYRSGYPSWRSFPFLRTLRLRSVMYLGTDAYPADVSAFWAEEGVAVFQYAMHGNKEPFDELDQAQVADALGKVLDRRNLPMLVHCNKGKHRVGCVVGCMRRLQCWSLASIFDEYRKFSAPKARMADQEFIEMFSHPVCVSRDVVPCGVAICAASGLWGLPGGGSAE